MPRRPSRATQDVLFLLLDDPQRHWYGRELGQEAGLASGSLYPILQRLEDEGLVTGHWEASDDAHQAGRPRRRYYALTAAGVTVARAEARAAAARLPRRGLEPGTAPA